MFRRIATISALAISLCGCIRTSEELAAQTQQDIINGQPVTTNDRGVVAISSSKGTCTGTMLNHFWVLTNKRCVTGIAQNGASIFLDGNVRTSKVIIEHPTQDVSLIILSAAMPINGAISGFSLAIDSEPNSSLQGQTLDCWGFGYNTFEKGGFGVLRHAPLEVTSTPSTGLLHFEANVNGQIQWWGDDGGTCFTTAGDLRVTGVNSTPSGSGAVVTATEVGPDMYRSWLLSLPFNQGPPVIADFDGDHRSDLVFASSAAAGLIIQSAKLPPGLPSRAVDQLPDEAAIWNQGPPLVGDFNGDGRDDLAFAWLANAGLQIRTKLSSGNGSYTSATQQFGEGAELWNKGQPLVGDFDGDHRDDIAFAWYGGNGVGLRIYTKLSNGNGIYTSATQNFADGNAIWNRGQPLVGDFNGDGRDDIAFVFRANAGLQIRTKLATGAGQYAAIEQQFSDVVDLWNKGQPLVGDFNGDGFDDIAFAWYAGDNIGLQIRTKLSNGNGTFRSLMQQLEDGDGIWSNGSPLVGDVNGDLRDDIVFARYAGAGVGLQIRTKLATALDNGTYTPVSQDLGDGEFIWNRGGPRLTDTDNDGRADLVFAFERLGRILIRVKRSTGSQFVALEAAL